MWQAGRERVRGLLRGLEHWMGGRGGKSGTGLLLQSVAEVAAQVRFPAYPACVRTRALALARVRASVQNLCLFTSTLRY